VQRRRQVKNSYLETEQFRRRAAIGGLVIALAVLALAFGYFRLQVLLHEEYRLRSESNRIKPLPIVPARGLIYDRNGRLLADNVMAYRLDVVPERIGDIDATLRALQARVAIDPDELRRFRNGYRAGSFRAQTLKLRLDETEVARLAVDRYRLPGVEVVPYLTRRYPYGPLLAHVIGYVGRVDEADREHLRDTPFSVLTHVGKSGLERHYEERLRGEVGFEAVETNVDGRVLRVLRRQPATAGTDLYLSLDVDLQLAMQEAFAGQHGAAVALDPATGEVLAMVSLPSYDPNLFVSGISHRDYAALTGDVARPLFNRNVLGGFAPGSTIKPFMALAGLEYGLRRPEDTVLSTGEFHIPGQARGYRDWRAGGHGVVNLRESLAQSVNTYYYRLAMDLGIERIDAYFGRLGFGQPTGIDLSGEVGGVLPSPEWKARQRGLGDRWYPGETVIAGIGQGYWVTSPLQLAQATAIIAAEGVRRRPHLVRETQAGFGQPRRAEPQPQGVRVVRDPRAIAAVREGMVAVLHGPTGTARSAAAGAPYLIAGKTGTAQRVSRRGSERLDPTRLPYHLRHQALFVGFAPADHPRIALAVVVEHGGSGSRAAAPVARRVFDAWLSRPGMLPPPAPAPAPAATPAADSPTMLPQATGEQR
jgi:penicillin-binding protein 2